MNIGAALLSPLRQVLTYRVPVVFVVGLVGLFSILALFASKTSNRQTSQEEFIGPPRVEHPAPGDVHDTEKAHAEPAPDTHDQQEENSSHDNNHEVDPTYNKMMDMRHFENGPHMIVTTVRPSNAADKARAEQILQSMREALAKYQDVSVAEADGYHYKGDKSEIKEKKNLVDYHFGSEGNGKYNKSSLDPAHPPSLLYNFVDGGFRLAGVMYHAPKGTTEDELHTKFFPLSESVWHKHIKICTVGGEKRLEIMTQEACDAVGGEFKAESNWMVHLYFG